MKRIAVIVTLACLIVAMTTGTAFARGCAGDSCGGAMVCAPDVAQTCPMADGPTMQHSLCDHEAETQARESTTAGPGHAPAALSVEALVIRPVLDFAGPHLSQRAPDARGAPHLSAVMRN